MLTLAETPDGNSVVIQLSGGGLLKFNTGINIQDISYWNANDHSEAIFTFLSVCLSVHALYATVLSRSILVWLDG